MALLGERMLSLEAHLDERVRDGLGAQVHAVRAGGLEAVCSRACGARVSSARRQDGVFIAFR